MTDSDSKDQDAGGQSEKKPRREKPEKKPEKRNPRRPAGTKTRKSSKGPKAAEKDSGTKRGKATPSEKPEAGGKSEDRRVRGEIFAAIAALLVGVPLVFWFAMALADGARRANEAPLRSMLGDDVFEQLRAGRPTDYHYLGNNRTAPDFVLPDRAGRDWRLADHRGKVVIMNFWSITCGPCVEEMPSLVRLSKMVKDRDDVELIAVSTDEGWDDVAELFQQRGNNARDLTILFDPGKRVVQDAFGTRLYPETWFIDADGVVRLRVDGPRDWASPLVLDLIDQFS
ncbi:MAG: TlpA disulfide reductase family protein [Myxococcota bacterium]